MSSTSAQAHNVMSELPASHPRRRHQLKRRGPVTWHLRKADKGPASLAIKNHFIAMIGEYVGTVLFMIFALGGTNVANSPSTSVTGSETAGQDGSTASTANTSNLLYIALSFGFSLAVNAWIFFRVSGGLFNPAVSLGMVLVGALTPVRGILLAFVQILGGITGAAIIQAITPGTLNVRTTLGGGCSIVQGLFIEMFLTSLLMLAILLLAAEKHKATFIAPIGIVLALFVAELLGVYYTGGALNPARSFGPNVVLRDFEGYHWIYWVGPILGAILAAGFYKMLKWLQYETVLGPETDVVPPPGGVKTEAQAHHDEEKQVEGKNNTGGNFVVAGPGLGDLLTEGNVDAVFDLERNPGPVEIRLQHMEDMLAQILAAQGGASQRISTSTFVDDGAIGGGKRYGNQGAFDNDTYGNGHGNGLLANRGDIGTGHGNVPGTGHGTGYGTGHEIGHADGLRGNVAAPYTDPIDTQDGRHAAVQQIINPEPHTHAHTPFVPAVAGAEGRPHVDAATRKL